MNKGINFFASFNDIVWEIKWNLMIRHDAINIEAYIAFIAKNLRNNTFWLLIAFRPFCNFH